MYNGTIINNQTNESMVGDANDKIICRSIWKDGGRRDGRISITKNK
jgi:hypothetical protein